MAHLFRGLTSLPVARDTMLVKKRCWSRSVVMLLGVRRSLAAGHKFWSLALLVVAGGK